VGFFSWGLCNGEFKWSLKGFCAETLNGVFKWGFQWGFTMGILIGDFARGF